MGIGTSIGAFFETDFDHQAGVVTPPKGDEGMVLKPQQREQNKQLENIEMTELGGIPVKYDTPLAQEEITPYADWKAKHAPNDSGEDYDLKGAFKAGVVPDSNGHMPDTWKKPNHPTFSNEGMYAKEAPELAGEWVGDRYIPNVGKPLIPDGGVFSKGNDKVNALVDKWGAKPEPRGEPQVLFKTKNGVEITDHDIEDGIHAGLAVGSTLESKGPFKSYIDMFLKPKAPVKELDSFESAYKSIIEVLDGPGAYEKHLAEQAAAKVTPKKIPLDYEKMEGSGKYEVFNPYTTEVHKIVNTEEEAKAFIKDFKPGTKPSTGWTIEGDKFTKKGYDLDLSHLTPFQKEQFIELQHRFGTNEIKYKEYKDEMNEYVKYIDSKKEAILSVEKPWDPETPPTYKKMMENKAKEDEGFAGWNKSDLKSMSPKEASENYWTYLTKQGQHTAEDFTHKYWNSQKGGNGYEMFQEHVNKLHKDNPFEQIPYEAKPEVNDVPKGWSEIPADKYKEANESWEKYVKELKNKSINNEAEMKALFKQIHIGKGKAKEVDPLITAAEQEAKEFALSKYDKFSAAIEKVKSKLFNSMIHERAKYHYDRLKETIPELALEKGYDTPAFRGLKNRSDIMSTHNFDNNHMYSSDSPLLADMYSDYLSKHPGWNNKPNAFSDGATVAPLVINTKNYYVFDAGGSSWQVANSKAVRLAVEEKKPGVIVKNVWDEPNSTYTLGKPATVYITFPSGASTVKSRFAEKFDPESKNMLHIVPVLAVGGAAGYVSTEAKDD